MQRSRIHIEHDAAMLADMAGAERPACDGLIVSLGRADDVLASTIRSNVLSGNWLLDADLPASRVLSWSGTLAEELFQPHPTTWLSPGHEALAAFCDEIAPQLDRHQRTLCFQPHARHVLNDPQSCARFLQQRSGEAFEIALAPASMLEPTMLDHLEDHLHRAFETLGGLGAMLMLSDVIAEGDDVRPVPLGDGVLPREVVLRLIDQHVPPSVPIVLEPGKLEQQRAWLEPLGGD